MGRYAQTGGDFTPAPAGTHAARCIKLIDLGTHHDEYEGKPTIRNQVLVMWELPNEKLTVNGEEKPAIVSKFYTNSLGEKANLRKDLESWRGRTFSIEELMKFDLEKVLGQPAMLSVIHTEKGKAKVVNVSKLMNGMTCPPAFNPPESFWIDEWDQARFDAISDGIKNIIMQSDEYKDRMGNGHATGTKSNVDTLDDDVPF